MLCQANQGSPIDPDYERPSTPVVMTERSNFGPSSAQNLEQTSNRRIAAILVAGLPFATPAFADELVCPGGSGVVVVDGGDRSEAICGAAAESIAQLASCNLMVPRPITVEIIQAMPGNCYGLYHCGEERIQLLPVEAYASFLSRSPENPFAHLDPEVFFNSILRHELAHAALYATPCRYEGCPATREFVAYTVQIWFLPDAGRAPFDERVAEAVRPMTRDGVSAVVLMMAPGAFIANAYGYLSQQKEPCALIEAISAGEVVFDLPFR